MTSHGLNGGSPTGTPRRLSSFGTLGVSGAQMKLPLAVDMTHIPINRPLLIVSKDDPSVVKVMPKYSTSSSSSATNSMTLVQPAWTSLQCDQLLIGGGLFQWSVLVESLGLPETKPLYIGCVPAGYSISDDKMFKHGGWGFGSDGSFRGELDVQDAGATPQPPPTNASATTNGNGRPPDRAAHTKSPGPQSTGLKFSSGDRVTIRLDSEKGTLQLFVGKSVSSFFKIAGLEPSRGVFPCISFLNYGTSVRLETVTDISPLSLLAGVLQITPQDRRTWERLYARMMDGEKIQLTEHGKRVELDKDDVKVRMVAWGGIENWNKELYSLLSNEKQSKKLREVALQSQSFLNVIFRLLDEQKASIMTEQEEMAKLVHGLVKRLDEQEQKFNSKLRVMEDMCARAHQDAAEAKKIATAAQQAAIHAANQNLVPSSPAMPPIEQPRSRSVSVSHDQSHPPERHRASFVIDDAAFTQSKEMSPDDHHGQPRRPLSPVHGSGKQLTPIKPSTAAPAPAPASSSSSSSSAPPAASTTSGSTVVRKKSIASLRPAPKISTGKAVSRITKPVAGAQKKPEKKPAPASPHRKPVSASTTSNEILQTIAKLSEMNNEIKALGEIGSPSDADLAKLEAKKKDLGMKKLELAKKLLIGAPTAQTEDAKEEIVELVDQFITEGDHIPGNKQLVSAFIHQIPTIDWASVVAERNWPPVAAFDGSLSYLADFLSIPGIRFDSIEVLQSSFYNGSCRIPAALLLLKNASVLRLEEIFEDVSAVWQEFFEDVASEARAIPKEDRTGRLELLKVMLDNPTFKIDASVEGTDFQTVFSRACKEGDLDLVHLLLEKGVVQDVNRVQPDTTNALMQAVIANRVEVVQYLTTAVTDLDVKHVSSEGSVLFLAKALGRDPKIAAALLDRGATLIAPPNQ